MAIVINGSGTVTGLAVGGLPDGTVDAGTLAANSVDSTELINGAIDASHLASGVGGKLLQVVQLFKTDDTTFASNSSWADISGYTQNITPSASTSKVLVTLSINAGTPNLAYIRIIRDSTEIASGGASGSRVHHAVGPFANTGDSARSYNFGVEFLDSPSTTNAVTYKLQGYCETGNTLYFNRSQGDSNNDTGWRNPSSITLKEIGA